MMTQTQTAKHCGGVLELTGERHSQAQARWDSTAAGHGPLIQTSTPAVGIPDGLSATPKNWGSGLVWDRRQWFVVVRSSDFVRGAQEGIVTPVRHIMSRLRWECPCADRPMRCLQPASWSRSL